MKRLDLLGMVLMIIGVEIILTAFSILMMIPHPVDPIPRFYTSFRIFIRVLLIIGASIIINGIIIRIVSHLPRESSSHPSRKNEKFELDLVNEIYYYLKSNKGKAYTLKALLNRVYEGNQILIRQNILEELLQELVIRNVIRTQLKDGEEFFLY